MSKFRAKLKQIADCFSEPYWPWVFLGFFIVLALILGFIFEECKIFGGQYFAEWIQEGVENRGNNGRDGRFTFYHAMIYIFVSAYAIAAITICAKKKDVNWCAIVIAISVVFLVFMNVYLTVLYDYKADSGVYSVYMTSYIAIATILSGIAGIKMTYLLKKSTESEEISQCKLQSAQQVLHQYDTSSYITTATTYSTDTYRKYY